MTPTHMFLSKFSNNTQNNYSTEQLWTVGSEHFFTWKIAVNLSCSVKEKDGINF